MNGIRIWDSGQIGFSAVDGGRNIRFQWQARFKNETTNEIAALRLRFFAMRGGKRFWQSNDFWVGSKFANSGMPHTGSILPFEKTQYIDGLGFTVPHQMWRADMYFALELLGASTYVRPDLRDAGHLFTKLTNSRAPDQLALFKKDPGLIAVSDPNGFNGTLIAFSCCAPDVIKFVMAHGGSSSSRTEAGSTIMHQAAMNGYPGVLDLAFKFGGNIEARTRAGRTPLDKAIVRGMPIGWLWLLKQQAKPHDAVGDGSTAWYAVDEGQIEALQALVASGMSPRWRDRYGNGLADYAVFNYIVLDSVAALKVPMDTPNPKTGDTPLMLAVANGMGASQAWFLRHGARLNVKDKQQRTVYDLAKLSNTLGTDRFFRDLVRECGRS